MDEAEERLRERLRNLAGAVAVRVPALEVDPDPTGTRLPARVARDDDTGAQRIVVSTTLLTGSDEEQTWHLASCLGWWRSPVPRRRRWRRFAVITAIAVSYGALAVAELDGSVHLPTLVHILGGPLLGFLGALAYAGLTRWERRSLDVAGHDVLAASGYSPAMLARQVFGGRQDPAWHRQLLHAEPAPSRRIAHADVWQLQPHRSLH